MKLRTMCSVISCVFWLVTCVQSASSIVPAPVNVSVDCNNFQTVVSWLSSQPLFRVYISSQGQTGFMDNVTTPWFDLSGSVWRTMFSSRYVYTVNVSAVSGGQESANTTSPKFTFNQLHESLVQKLCTLDLPQVEVLVRGEVATVTFRNPMKLYPQLQWAQEIQPSDPLVLSFDVTEHNVTQRGECRVEEETCTLDFMLPSKKEEYCLSLNAGLHNHIHIMNFNHKPAICVQPKDVEAEHYWLFLALLLVFFSLVVCSVGFSVWKSKACFLTSPSLPLTLDPRSWSNRQQSIMDPQSERVDFLRANGPSSSSVVITQKPSDPADGLTEPSDQETLSVDLSESPGDSCPGVLYCARIEDPEEEDPEEEDPEEEEVVVEGEPVPDYDRPHFPNLDMGDGDIVQGYGL